MYHKADMETCAQSTITTLDDKRPPDNVTAEGASLISAVPVENILNNSRLGVLSVSAFTA